MNRADFDGLPIEDKKKIVSKIVDLDKAIVEHHRRNPQIIDAPADTAAGQDSQGELDSFVLEIIDATDSIYCDISIEELKNSTMDSGSQRIYKARQAIQLWSDNNARRQELKGRIDELRKQPGTTDGNGWGYDWEKYNEDRIAELTAALNTEEKK